MAAKIACRRRNDRFCMGDGTEARVEFSYPWPAGYRCSMRLRDLSASGLSFVLGRELPGLEAGQPLDDVTLVVGDHRVHGDMVVMHLTPDNGAGAVCGAVFLPGGDREAGALNRLVEELAQTADYDGAVLR